LLPLETLPDAEVRALQGVCFDVDDTVTRDGTLDPDAYRAMFALREAGLKLIAATGRPLGFAEVLARTWPVDAAVGENGAGYIARAGRALRFGYWDPPAVRATQQHTLAAIRARVARELPHVETSSDGWARRCDLAFDIAEQRTVAEADVERLLAIIADEGAQASVSSIHAHAQLGQHDKARGIVLAAEALFGIDEARCQRTFAFVGDSGNDAAAFAFFELTVGVSNVRSHLSRLRVPPRYVSSRSCGEGFAEIAHALLALRSGS
jgi:HAD superfamily hydrolase (TIGR01484 family)